MASWQAHLLVALLKLGIKRRLRGEVNVARARATVGAAVHGVPKGVAAEPGMVGGIAGEWLRPDPGDPPGTLLYLHGGAYIACSPMTHRPITAGFASRGLRVFAPDYRLAPEHPFPAAIEDAVTAYRGLLASGIPPGRIAIAGDSAGGGLALATLLTLRDAGDALPAAAMLFSPWTDLAATGATLVSNSRRDAMFYGAGASRAGLPYLGGADPANPLASPLYAALHGLPPTLVHTGSHEILLADSTRLVERARAAGSAMQLRTWRVVPHVWPLFGFLPEARESLDEAARFLIAAIGEPEA